MPKTTPRKPTVDNYIRRAAKLWGLEDWEFTWRWGHPEFIAEIDPTFWCEKRALITLDKKAFTAMDRTARFRTITHEIGHAVLEPMDRGYSDWAAHFVLDATVRATWEEQLNTRQNEVLDHIIVRVLHL